MLKFEPDVGLISAAVKWIARLIMSDNVRLLDAEIGSREPVEDLVLWHIPVENQRRKLRPVSSVANCSVDLEFFGDGNYILKVEGRWNSDDGPIEHQDLRPDGRRRTVPIVLGSSRARLFKPGTLRQTVVQLEPAVAHVLCKNFLVGGNNHQRLHSGDYEVKVSVEREGKEIKTRTYALHVPQPPQADLTMSSKDTR